MEDNVKVYVMVNKSDGASIRCEERHLPMWLARGFEVESIEFVNRDEYKSI